LRTGIVKDRRFADHDMGPFHVESPRRIEVLNRMVDEEIRFPFLAIEPRPALEEEIELIHSPAYVRLLKETSGKPPVTLDPDTSTSKTTYDTALLAAGGGIKAVDLVAEGRIGNAFALVRPPGHHAEVSRAMGFCFFNNAAIAAEHLIRARGLRRILIVDWDIHHGNGTQQAFYDRSDILYFSTHQTPLYPGTGGFHEVGEGKGEGYTLNIPLRPGKNDQDFLWIFQNILRPVAASFEPDFVIVSAGFDIAEGDPIGRMSVSRAGFGWLAAEVMAAAEGPAGGRVVMFLEGGYDLSALKDGVKEVLLRMSGTVAEPPRDARLSAALAREIGPALAGVKKYWGIDGLPPRF
jgi:acetoin utilization deacetylase AcuC-like enzyme